MTPTEWSALRLSMLVGVCSVALTLPPAAVLAHLLAHARFRGRSLVETLLLLPLVLPPVVTGYYLLVLFGPRHGPLGGVLDALGIEVLFTWRGAVLAAAVVSFPLAYRACRVAFEEVDPRLVALSRTLGAGPVDSFTTISVPLARRGILAGAVLVFVRSMGEFGATMVLAGNVAGETQTLPLLIWTEFSRPGSTSNVAWLSFVALLMGLAALWAIEGLVRRDGGRS